MKCVHGHKRQKGEVKGESDLRKHSQTVNLSFFTNSECAVTQLLPVDGQTGVNFNPLKTEMDEQAVGWRPAGDPLWVVIYNEGLMCCIWRQWNE